MTLHLALAIGSVNAARSNKQYSELLGSSPAFGSCAAKIDGNRFEPPARAKGEVARAGLYMADAYGPRFRISDQQRNLFEAWDRMFPVTDWECTRAKRQVCKKALYRKGPLVGWLTLVECE